MGVKGYRVGGWGEYFTRNIKFVNAEQIVMHGDVIWEI
jgi:hypothetical protein